MADVRLEVIEDMYVTYLKDKLEAYLTAEEAFWVTAGGPNFPLPLPDEWHTGNIPAVALEYVVAKLPAVTVEAVALEPTSDTLLGRIDMIFHLYSVAESPGTANRQNHRYGHCLQMCLNDGKPRGINEVLQPGLAVAETVVDATAAYLKGARVVLPLLINAPF